MRSLKVVVFMTGLTMLGGSQTLRAQAVVALTADQMTVKHDDFNGTDVALTAQKSVITQSHYGDVGLSLQRFTDADRTVSYQVFISYIGTEWAFWYGPLALLVDGTHMTLPALGEPARRVEGNHILLELLTWTITPAQLRQLAAAKEIRIQLRSQNEATLEPTLSDDNLRLIQGFVAGWVK